eukprot:6175901-Pleurochrysis_carterae.AAC.3
MTEKWCKATHAATLAHAAPTLCMREETWLMHRPSALIVELAPAALRNRLGQIEEGQQAKCTSTRNRGQKRAAGGNFSDKQTYANEEKDDHVRAS